MVLPLTLGDFYIHPAVNTQESFNSKINERIKTDKHIHSNNGGPYRRVQYTEKPGEENHSVTLKTCMFNLHEAGNVGTCRLDAFNVGTNFHVQIFGSKMIGFLCYSYLLSPLRC